MMDGLDTIERVGTGMLERATTPTVLAPLHLPVIEQMFNDIYDARYPLGVFSQVRWLQGRARKRRWRNLVDETYERMGVAVLEAMVSLTAFQVGQLQRELQQAEALRFEAERLELYNRAQLETQLTVMGEQHRIHQAQTLLQAQVDQAAEKLRQQYGLVTLQSTQRHDLALENQRLFNDMQRTIQAAQLRLGPQQRTAEGLAAIQRVWAEMAEINGLPDEDEKHRRLTMLNGALPYLLQFDE